MDTTESKGRRDDVASGDTPPDRKEIKEQLFPVYTEEEYKSIYYKSFNKMGKAVIVNNLSQIQGEDGRLKAKLQKLKDTLSELQFEGMEVPEGVTGKVDEWEYQDLTADEVKALMDIASSNDFSEHYCVFVIILTYGKDGVLEFRNDRTKADNRVEICTLQEKFKGIPMLNMKPKLFFIQCGDKPEEKPDDARGKVDVSLRKIPREADFFTYLYGLRTFVKQEDETDREFMFVDTLTEALEDHVRKPSSSGQEPMEINKLTIKMNAMIEVKLTTVSGDEIPFHFNDGDMKIPCVTDTLTKRMNFNHGDPEKRKGC